MKRARGSRFRDNDSGAVAPTIALSLFALIAVGGIGFDYARMAAMDSELQNAADQAALAAATQLDGETDARTRATTAAQSLVTNSTLFSNDNVGSTAISIPTANVVFYVDKAKTTVATTDADANFVEVTTVTREANFALTPIVAAFSSGPLEAIAFAGVDSAICKVPPMMICNPDPSVLFNALGKVGWGIQVTGKGGGSWAPGDFGFLEVGDGQKADLEKALAFGTTTYDCTPIEGTAPQTGNAQGLFRAVNTRFDIYDTTGNPLGDCQSSDCPPAQNVLKDLVKPNTNTGGNACRPHNSGWQLPPTNRQFWPKDETATSGTAMEQINDTSHSPSIDAMGLPRDNCHYASFNSACGNDAGNKFGDGNWARGDYFNRYHSGRIPASASTMTRYQTYRWELDEGHVATIHGSNAGSNKQYSAPVCSVLSDSGVDRRVLSVAVVKNCAALSGASVDVEVDEWVDMFLVEPVFDARGNGSVADSIYMEVIGPSSLGNLGGASGPQTIRKDVPYLIE